GGRTDLAEAGAQREPPRTATEAPVVPRRLGTEAFDAAVADRRVQLVDRRLHDRDEHGGAGTVSWRRLERVGRRRDTRELHEIDRVEVALALDESRIPQKVAGAHCQLTEHVAPPQVLDTVH